MRGLTKKLTCSICSGIVIQLTCEHIICSDFQMTSSLKCPCCTDHTLSSSTVPPLPLLMSLLNDLLLSCVRKCGNLVKLKHYEDHLNGNCSSHYEVMNSPTKVTLRDVLCKPSTTPASPGVKGSTSPCAVHNTPRGRRLQCSRSTQSTNM